MENSVVAVSAVEEAYVAVSFVPSKLNELFRSVSLVPSKYGIELVCHVVVPVPPYEVAIADPCHTPLVIVPIAVDPVIESVVALIVGAVNVVPSNVRELEAVTASAVALV